MDANGFITLFSGIALLAAKPGPGMMAVASRAMGEGLGSAAAFILGNALAKLVIFTLVVLGYSFLPDTAMILSVVLKSLTAAFLIWLGAKGLLRPAAEPDMPARRNISTPAENFMAGLMVTISNPFDILFFTGILPTIVSVGNVSLGDYALCALVIVLAYMMVAFSYAIPIALSHRFIRPGLVRRLNVVASVGIILVGLYIAYSVAGSL